MARSTETDRLIACQRFGLGARKGVPLPDPRAALQAELATPAGALITTDEIIAASRTGIIAGSLIDMGGAAPPMSGPEMFAVHLSDEARIAEARRTRKAAAQMASPAMGNDMGGGGMQAGQMQAAPATTPRPPEPPRVGELFYRREAQARVVHAIRQPVGLVERLVMFWSNHFAVSIQKGLPLRALAGPFEREAIRPHVLGRFEDMLLAVEQHPAMLIFLDNRGSVGPNSRAGKNQKRGLNENLAREILELHTLGVNGGYAQADVTNLARIITGWTVAGLDARLAAPGAFAFNAHAHEPGDHALLGKTYGEWDVRQGAAALRDLARHPATARFIAGKLARHFISDDPPKDLVARLEHSFLETKGDLRKVISVLIEAESAWSVPLVKLRTPYEHLIATFRAFDRVPELPWEINGALSAAGQPLWGPHGPNGYSDSVDSIAAPEAMKTRLEAAAATARRMGGPINPLQLAGELYGSTLSRETHLAISRAETKPQGHAILLMSPEFLRR
ncbi:MAG: DUF1800 family protein [Proteobacteria bacterium]|nr:DUF1800 family protein [Pseudomonadota bacterium]